MQWIWICQWINNNNNEWVDYDNGVLISISGPVKRHSTCVDDERAHTLIAEHMKIKRGYIDIPSWSCTEPLRWRSAALLGPFRHSRTWDSVSSLPSWDAARRWPATRPMPILRRSFVCVGIHNSRLQSTTKTKGFLNYNSFDFIITASVDIWLAGQTNICP